MLTKSCSCCKKEKSITNFHKNRKAYSCFCIECHRLKCRNNYYAKKKPPIIKNDFYPLNGELWKDIEGYESIYQISNFGRVRSLRRSRIVSQRLSKSGYLNVTLRKESSSKLKGMRVNRLVALAFVINTDNKPYVNHLNAIKTDNHYQNLEWCTQSENIKHAYRIGTKKPSNKYLCKK